jgi:hypothetical protein
MNISISQIQIIPVNANNGLVAFASFVLNESIYLTSVGVYTRLSSLDEYRLVFPTKTLGNKEINIFYPINQRVGKYLEIEVTKALKKDINQKCDKDVRYSNIECTRDVL